MATQVAAKASPGSPEREPADRIFVDSRPLNAFKCKAFSLRAVHHETHLPTVSRQAQAHAWISRAHEKRRWSQSALGAARHGPCPPRSLSARFAAAAVDQPGERRYRLTGVGAYDALFAEGRRRDGEFLQLLFLPARLAPGRAGYAIPKKVLPLAVDRNRIRRVLREAVRAARPPVAAYDVVLRLKRSCPRADARLVGADARRLLAALPGAGTSP
jgi:ribonuclease P protein component